MAKKKSERERYWHKQGFAYIGTGNLEVGMKRNPQIKDGDRVADIRQIDVLVSIQESKEVNRERVDTKTLTGNFGFWFSDPLIANGKPYQPGASANLDPEFRANLKMLDEKPCRTDAA